MTATDLARPDFSGLVDEFRAQINGPIEPATLADGEWIKALLKADGYRFQGALSWYRWTHDEHGPDHHWDVIRPLAFVHWGIRKRDGVRVAYEAAVHLSARKQGLGTRLMNYVGTPFEGKVDVDNDASNGMLRALGFQIIKQVPTRPNRAGTHKLLNVWQSLDAIAASGVPAQQVQPAISTERAAQLAVTEHDAPWRNRIVDYADMRPDALTPHPNNPRQHGVQQMESLGGVLESLGVIQNVVWNRTTGRIIDGHARHALAIARQEAFIPVTVVELSEPEEALALATFDPLGSLAVIDKAQFQELLKTAETDNLAVRALLDEIAAREQIFGLSTGALADLANGTLGGPGEEATTVTFKFGDVSGQVDKAVYARFSELYPDALKARGTLSDVLNAWVAQIGDGRTPLEIIKGSDAGQEPASVVVC